MGLAPAPSRRLVAGRTRAEARAFLGSQLDEWRQRPAFRQYVQPMLAIRSIGLIAASLTLLARHPDPSVAAWITVTSLLTAGATLQVLTLAWHSRPQRQDVVAEAGLLFDLIFLGYLIAITGGSESPLMPLAIAWTVIGMVGHSGIQGLLYTAGIVAMILVASITGDPVQIHARSEVLFTTRALAVVGIGAAVGVGLNQFAAIQRTLQTTALRDSLTGLWNRRALEDRLVQFSAVAQRTEAPFSLAMIDLDHFKEVNDEYGHEAGDLALCHFARLLEATMRETDEVFRYGGEEFVVAFPATTVDNAYRSIERLRQRLAQDPPSTGPIGFSAGVATGTDLAAVHEADAALFAAKRAGRGRTYGPGFAA